MLLRCFDDKLKDDYRFGKDKTKTKKPIHEANDAMSIITVNNPWLFA